MRLVLVKWLDADGCAAGWEIRDDIEAESCEPCRSVGWLWRDRGGFVDIVPHLADGDCQQFQGRMRIPKCTIVEMVDLEPSQEVIT